MIATYCQSINNQKQSRRLTMKALPVITAVIIALMLLPAVAPAAVPAGGKVTVNITTSKEVVVTKNGKREVKVVPAKKFAPGDIIIYTINYKNTGKEPATDAVIIDPVPEGTSYVTDSATGENADITYSIDGGKSYRKPTVLYYEVEATKGKKEKKVASPEMYTHIRWTVSSIPPGGGGKAGFKVRVK
jgi:uncharacterized repeat protein (TIGR01451 family)